MQYLEAFLTMINLPLSLCVIVGIEWKGQTRKARIGKRAISSLFITQSRSLSDSDLIQTFAIK